MCSPHVTSQYLPTRNQLFRSFQHRCHSIDIWSSTFIRDRQEAMIFLVGFGFQTYRCEIPIGVVFRVIEIMSRCQVGLQQIFQVLSQLIVLVFLKLFAKLANAFCIKEYILNNCLTNLWCCFCPASFRFLLTCFLLSVKCCCWPFHGAF